MALFKSPIFSQASGSLAGTVFSHNRGGMYIRARATPTNPNTTRQQVVRSTMTALSNRWSYMLTPGERALWTVYADNTPVINRLGDSVTLTGQQHYLRSNVPRVAAALDIIDVAPILFNLGSYTPLGMGGGASGDPYTVGLTFDNTDGWAATTGGAAIILFSRPQNAGINFFKAPFQGYDTILGNTGLPPTSPEIVTAPFEAAVTQRVFLQYRITQADGRLSPTNVLSTLLIV